jgi:hypothetical protein
LLRFARNDVEKTVRDGGDGIAAPFCRGSELEQTLTRDQRTNNHRLLPKYFSQSEK